MQKFGIFLEALSQPLMHRLHRPCPPVGMLWLQELVEELVSERDRERLNDHGLICEICDNECQNSMSCIPGGSAFGARMATRTQSSPRITQRSTTIHHVHSGPSWGFGWGMPSLYFPFAPFGETRHAVVSLGEILWYCHSESRYQHVQDMVTAISQEEVF